MHGLRGVSPLDPLPGETAGETAADGPGAIARRNETHIRLCDAVLANLTPFRGPSADPGTVYEVGFARGLGRPVFGFTCVTADYAARVRSLPGSGHRQDGAGLLIEDSGLADNLMIACGIAHSHGFILARDVADPWTDLTVFELCVQQAAAVLHRLGSAR